MGNPSTHGGSTRVFVGALPERCSGGTKRPFWGRERPAPDPGPRFGTISSSPRPIWGSRSIPGRWAPPNDAAKTVSAAGSVAVGRASRNERASRHPVARVLPRAARRYGPRRGPSGRLLRLGKRFRVVGAGVVTHAFGDGLPGLLLDYGAMRACDSGCRTWVFRAKGTGWT